MKKLFFSLLALILLGYFLILSARPIPLYLSAWITYWNFDKALTSLNNNKSILNEINPFIYSFDNQGDAICLLDQNRLGELKKLNCKIIPTIVNDVIPENPKERILKDPNIIHKIISNPKLLDSHISQIVSLVRENNFSGIDIDYEKLNSSDYHNFINFLKKLYIRMHDDKKQLSVTIEPVHILKNTGLNIKVMSKYCDKINIMCYNYSSDTTKPIAPLSWVEKIIKKARKIIPRDKISIALKLESLRENQKSIAEKIKLLKKYKIRKIAIWHLGSCDPRIFELF